MKKTLILLFVFVFLGLFCGQVFAQKPKVFQDIFQEKPAVTQSQPEQRINIPSEVISKTESGEVRSTNVVNPIKIEFQESTKEPKVEGCKNLCGNGVCQEMVCLAFGCPCPETFKNCPGDCKNEVVPPASTSSAATVMVMPVETKATISPNLEKPILINERPIEVTGIKATPVFSFEVKSTSSVIGSSETSKSTINVSVNSEKRETSIESGGMSATTQENIKIEDSVLTIETTSGFVAMPILPNVVTETVVSSQSQEIKEIKLKTVKNRPFYEVKSVKKSNIFLLFPVSFPMTTHVSAETGKITEIKKPWWSFLTI